MKHRVALCLLFAACASSNKQSKVADAQKTPPASAPASEPASEPASAPAPRASGPMDAPAGLDAAAVDPSVSPCDDFYRYACGNWMKATPIPADQSRWGRGFSEIQKRNEEVQKQILEELAKAKPVKKAKGEALDKQKIGDYYGACMDEATVEKTSGPALKALLKKIDGMKKPKDLPGVLAFMHLSVANAFFGFGSQQDFQDSTLVIGVADQAGLGLPDKDYYLKDDEKSKMLRAAYGDHVAKMFTIAGDKPEVAKSNADVVMKIETELAKASMSRVDRRDPKKIYHRLELAGLEKAAPSFDWKAYLKGIGVAKVTQINVAVPEFFAGFEAVLKMPMPELKTYLKWHTLNGVANFLGKSAVDEHFAFYGKTLTGTAELKPRWKRCVAYTDQALGEALGREFVQKTFGADGKSETQKLITEVEAAMDKDIDTIDWMDQATKAAAKVKLAAIANKVGYPDKWRDYSKVKVGPKTFLANALSAGKAATDHDLQKIGKPVDKNEWGMTPPTVNAYYDASLNQMVFPAGILQPPFYNKAAVKPVNYGAIGMVMGHEITHGFDDEGRQFDEKGNLRDWWSPEVGKKFEERAQCVVEQYNGYTAVDAVKVNGQLTLGENIADLGGLKVAYAAYMAHRGDQKAGSLTDAQAFFMGYAQSWCMNQRDEIKRVLANVDPHSPPEFRVNGPLSNLPEFAEAFQCKAGNKMVRPNRCTVW
ncbi:MAG: M13 family peptidase [Deltaproteobacteria bacterium]|nr:M13 family peptidase [Deltaproteobacteria bacterium]